MHVRGPSEESITILRYLSGTWADQYIQGLLITHLSRAVGLEVAHLSSLRERLTDPYHSLEAVYAQYAFARRGSDRAELAALAVRSLDRHCGPSGVRAFLEDDSGRPLWDTFCEVCEQSGRRPLEQLNYGVIAGLAELAQQVYQTEGGRSITTWIADAVMASGRVEPQFERLVQIRGVGPKLASVMIRDLVHLFEVEDALNFADRIYTQPIDKWLRATAPFVVPDLGDPDAPDWILAGKISKFARRAGVSAIRFNMGCTYFGMREVREPEVLPTRLSNLINGPVKAYC